MFGTAIVSSNQHTPSYGWQTEVVPLMYGLLVREEPIDLDALAPAPAAAPAKKRPARRTAKAK